MDLTQPLRRALQTAPDRPATAFADRTRTVADHADRVARVAGALRALGVERGARVAILGRNSDRYAEVLLAVPWSDAVLVPLNTRWNVGELAYALDDSGTDVLFVDDSFADQVSALRELRPQLRTVVSIGDASSPLISYEGLVAEHDPIAPARRDGDGLVGLFYTGGTTGFPKGVMLTDRNLLTSALGTQATVPVFVSGGRQLHAAPLFHIAALTGWLMQWVVGGTHVILPAFEPATVLRAVEEHRITTAVLVPSMIQALATHPDVASHDLTSLRTILYGGSPITEAAAGRAAKAFPMTDLVQAYGMTEVSPTATVLAAADHRDHRLRSAGQAAVHSEVMIVDADDHEVPRDTVGEILVRGDHVMHGYWNLPDGTAEALRGGWMHTGDLGSIDADGYLFVVDRLKDMIVTGSENVYSVEVENAIDQHPDVLESAVFGVPDRRWGERVHAVVVVRAGAPVEERTIVEHCRDRLARYKVPRSVELRDQPLPRSGAGKVLKRQLREPYWTGHERRVS